MKSVVSKKGQVTIPKALRDRLGIRPGTVLEFEARSGKLVGVKADTHEDPVTQVTGILRTPLRTDEYLEESRGPAR